jgi:hypothetical protein
MKSPIKTAALDPESSLKGSDERATAFIEPPPVVSAVDYISAGSIARQGGIGGVRSAAFPRATNEGRKRQRNEGSQQRRGCQGRSLLAEGGSKEGLFGSVSRVRQRMAMARHLKQCLQARA